MPTSQAKNRKDNITFTGMVDANFMPKVSQRASTVAYLIFTIFLGIILMMATHAQWMALIIYVPLIAFLGLFLPIVRRWLSPMPIFAAIMQTFAQRNKFTYTAAAKPDFPELFEPAVVGTGIWEKREQLVEGSFMGRSFKTYIYTSRHPFENSIGRAATRVYELSLDKVYPHIFLATRIPGNTKYHTNTYRHFDDDQRMQLEGTFEDYFISYTHRRTNTDARVILAPNVMQTILRTNHTFNLEIIGDKLFLYSPDFEPTITNVGEALTILEAFSKHMDRLDKNMKFVLPRDDKYPRLRSRAGFGTVQLGGRYFNGSIAFLVIWNVSSVLRVIFTNSDNKSQVYIELVVLALADIIAVTALLLLRKKYKNSL